MPNRRNAPAVQFPLRPALIQAAVLAALWLAGAAVTGWWVQAAGPAGWRLWLAAATLACAAVAALLAGLRVNTGTLIWDSPYWRFESLHGMDWPPGSIAAIRIPIDLQGLVLAQLVPASGAAGRRQRWLWLERRQSPAAWKALRRALVANGGPADQWMDGNRQESGHERT